MYGGGQILQPTTINDLLTHPHTDERHFTLLSEEPRVAVPKLRGENMP